MAISKTMLRFLSNLAHRHIGPVSSITRSLRNLSEGKVAVDMDMAVIPDGYYPFAAATIAAAGGVDAEQRTELMAEACAAAIKAADAKADAKTGANELVSMLADAIDAFAIDEAAASSAKYAEFIGTEVQVKNGNYIFHGRSHYPIEIVLTDGKYRLINASHKKGVYRRVAE